MHTVESLVYNRFYILYDYNHYDIITNVQYILGLNFISPILSVLSLNCFTKLRLQGHLIVIRTCMPATSCRSK